MRYSADWMIHSSLYRGVVDDWDVRILNDGFGRVG
jgi:hypothetical protein